ncbi:hypothetical protein JCM5350_000180 [Sporobolomyces pararoseus]
MVHSVPSSPTLSPSSPLTPPTSTTTNTNGTSNAVVSKEEEELSIASLEKEELIELVEKLKLSYELLQERFESNERERDREFEEEDRSREREEREEKVRDLERELLEVRERESEIRRDQERMEEELAGRIEVLEKLRGSVRELERDKRETLKRYREQSDSFDSERQSWYDQEQHYKSRIQNLSTQRKSNKSLNVPDAITAQQFRASEDSEEPLGESETRTPAITTNALSPPRSPVPTSTSPTPLELSLQSQLDTLQTAHSSLSTTLRTLQTEMTDLKRVYKDLQEENESYEILLGEKTLSGEVTGTDFFRKSFSWGEGGTVEGGGAGNGNAWTGFGFQGGLEAVGEEDGDFEVDEEEEDSESESEGEEEEEEEEDIEKILLESKGTGSIGSGAVSAQSSSNKRRSSRRNRSIALAHAKRDSTSFVPSLSGGLDLAAELEAAQKEEELDEVEIEKKREKEEKRNRKREERENKKREARAARRDGSQSMPVGLEELHLEIKQLREANKALTLYVSKIVDRVCSQEGFEKVLAVDYRTNNTTPKADNHSSSPKPSQAEEPTPSEPPATTKKPRPVSTSFFSRASVSPGPTTKEPSTPKTAGPSSTGLAQTPSSASSVGSTTTTTTANGPRRSGGLTWDGISSVFGFGSSSASSATQSPSVSSSLSRSATTTPSNGIRPLMLSTPEGARRLSISDEDEDDMIERERLRVDMSRHGIEYAPTLAQIGRPRSSSSATSPTDGVSPASLSPLPPPSNLDPIEEAEKQLRAQEKEEETIRQQIVKEGRGSGLTEAPPRRMNKLERRHSSRGSSISYNLSPSSSSIAINGLGIDSPSPVATSGSVSPANIVEEPEKGGETEEEGQKWTKALRRMSRGWTSPPVS